MAEPLGAGSQAHALTAADGVALRAATRPGGARGLALILQGRTEFCEKYAPVADALGERGFAVATLDWRGQGASARLLDNPRMGHIEDFAAFQTDLAAALAADPVAALGPPRLVIAHSMGGAIALRALLDGALSAPCVVFSAPMWGLGLSRVSAFATGALARAATGLGYGDRYAPGGADESYATTQPEFNVLTSDPEQAAWLAELTRRHADKALGGVTWTWLRAAMREMKALRGQAWTGPGLVIAGDDERVTSLDAMRARAGRDGLALTLVPGGRHELFLETPPRRAAAWAAIDAFADRCGV